MTALTVKVLLAFFALLTAVLGFFDIKSIEPQDPYRSPVPWWRRITRMGFARLFCAVATFGFLARSEYINYSALQDSDAKAKEQSEQVRLSGQRIVELQKRIEQAKEGIASSVLETKRLGMSNRNLVTSLDGAIRRAGTAEVPEDKIDETMDLVFSDGEKVIPKDGDRLDWTVSCLSSLPPLRSSEQGDDCRAAGYGSLVANGRRIAINSLASHRVYSNRSSGAQLRYEPPYCLSTSSSLKESHCTLQIEVMREVRWRYEQLQEHDTRDAGNAPPIEALEACRAYTALYGERCEDIH